MNKDVIYIRVDKEFKNKIEELAKKDQRSLNNFVIYVLSKYIEKKK